MYQAPDILMMAYKQPVMQDQLTVLYEKERQIPGSVQYTIKRYQRHPQWNLDDMGMMVYQYKKRGAGPELPRAAILPGWKWILPEGRMRVL